jgi:methionyl-tRNA formyltransferase
MSIGCVEELPVRIVFFGTDGVFSRAPLAALVDAGCDVCAVVVPPPAGLRVPAPLRRLEPPSRMLLPPLDAPGEPVRRMESSPRVPLPLLAIPGEPTVIGMAWARGIPVLEVADIRAATSLEALATLRPDLFCVACFPRLLPAALLQVPRLGALNVHPSLLPRYRGPFPLFWVFHDGLEHAGVSVHLLDNGADSGPIVLQEPVRLPDGISYDQAERRCSTEGARLLVDAVWRLAAGQAGPRAQEQSQATQAPSPRDDDFVVTPNWPARRAFNFIRGLAGWEQPICVQLGEMRLPVREAISWDETALPLDSTVSIDGRLALRYSPGTLTVIVEEP